jgi:hypothetical protein
MQPDGRLGVVRKQNTASDIGRTLRVYGIVHDADSVVHGFIEYALRAFSDILPHPWIVEYDPIHTAVPSA